MSKILDLLFGYEAFDLTSGVNITTNGIGKINTDKVSAVQNAHKILSENIARIPIVIKKDGEIIKEHSLFNVLNNRPNNYQNINQLLSLIENDRNKYGNAFLKIHRKVNIKSLERLNPTTVTGWKIVNNQLYYIINKKVVNSENIIHFRQPISIDGIFGITPLTSLNSNISIYLKALNTIDNFYDNNAIAPLVLSSEIPTASMFKSVMEAGEKFKKENNGYQDAGKMIKLPPNMKLTPLDINLIDSELINTMKFNRDEIASLYGIPNYMMNSTDYQGDIEQQSREFRNNTIAPIISIYKSELEFKLLTSSELFEGYTIDFNSDILIDADLKTKALSYKTLVANGMMTPNEAIRKLGNKEIDSVYGDKHYVQQQYITLEDYDKLNINQEKLN